MSRDTPMPVKRLHAEDGETRRVLRVCPACGKMIYQPGAEKCDVVGCGQRLDWSWWRYGM